jgi:glutamine amidotransferase
LLKIALVDVGLGNSDAVLNALLTAGHDSDKVQQPDLLADYDVAVFPGVGHWAQSLELLHVSGFYNALKDYALSGKRIVGICLGMQLLGMKSEEGLGNGLGLLNFSSVRLNSKPSMGWFRMNRVHRPWGGVSPNNERLYFVHSFGLFATGSEFEAMTYIGASGHEIVAAIHSDNIIGLQFHPEKSLKAGLRILSDAVAIGSH